MPGTAGRPYDLDALRRNSTQRWRPASGIEINQGNPYAAIPDLAETMQVPRDPGINQRGWINPYSLTFYQAALSTTAPTRVAPPNLRRAYLIIQNQGPGNVFVNYGSDAVAPSALLNSNCLQLVSTQVYEQIGGGGFDFDTGLSRPICFVSPDYLSAITDTVATTLLIGEGVWINREWQTART